jgi:ABC-type sulfate transport system permease component
MQVIYGFIYYFIVFMLLCLLSLSVFLLQSMRHMLVRFWRKFKDFLEATVINYTIIITFSVIGIVFLQSLYTLFVLETHFSKSKQIIR